MTNKKNCSSLVKTNTTNKFWVAVSLIFGLGIMPIEPAQAVNFAGSDLTTNDAWRTSSSVKLLDADGDNIYGTDGYTIFRSDRIGTRTTTNDNIVQSPGYASINTLPGLGYFSTPVYIDIDDPSQTGSAPVPNIDSGVLTQDFVGAGTTEFFDITFTQAGNYRIGFLFDNGDTPTLSPLAVTLAQTVGGSDSATASLSSDRDSDVDYYFFDIEASINDVYRLSGAGDPGRASNVIGGVTFDTNTSAAVVFESTPSLGLIIMAGAFGISGYVKNRNAKKVIEKL